MADVTESLLIADGLAAVPEESISLNFSFKLVFFFLHSNLECFQGLSLYSKL